jgi:ribonuclease-3
VRASVVNSAALAEVAAELGIGAALYLGKGEDSSGGREKPSILADAMEAVIGAVYLDGGWPAAATLVMTLLGERIGEAAAGPGGQDYKTRLQELSARQFDQLPRYQVVDDGPDHSKRFYATVSVAGIASGRGEGRSKKQAEQAAAREAWLALTEAAVASAPALEVLAPPPAVDGAVGDRAAGDGTAADRAAAEGAAAEGAAADGAAAHGAVGDGPMDDRAVGGQHA